MPTLNDYQKYAKDDYERALLTNQSVEIQRSNIVTCNCGAKVALRHGTRCLYCGVWFCTKCAETHFGQTVAEWRAARESGKKEQNGLTGAP